MQTQQISRPAFRVRGRENTVEFLFDDGSPIVSLKKALRDHLWESHARYRDLSVVVNIGRHVLDGNTTRELLDTFAEFGVSVGEVRSSAEAVENELAAALSVPVTLGKESRKQVASQGRSDGDGNVMIVRHTCRTGTRIQHPGTIVVMGNVNPGAELTAGGDVIVVGNLRGVAHAGAFGNEQACIMASLLSPTQLRIAGFIAVGPPEREPANLRPSQSEIAFVRSGSIVIEPYASAPPKELREHSQLDAEEAGQS